MAVSTNGVPQYSECQESKEEDLDQRAKHAHTVEHADGGQPSQFSADWSARSDLHYYINIAN